MRWARPSQDGTQLGLGFPADGGERAAEGVAGTSQLRVDAGRTEPHFSFGVSNAVRTSAAASPCRPDVATCARIPEAWRRGRRASRGDEHGRGRAGTARDTWLAGESQPISAAREQCGGGAIDGYELHVPPPLVQGIWAWWLGVAEALRRPHGRLGCQARSDPLDPPLFPR